MKGSSGTALTLKAGLESMKSSDLVCLKISDYGTDGLTGDDWDEKGNFRKLCVQNFSTGKESGLGGSFGLGRQSAGCIQEYSLFFSHQELKAERN